jgi:hypothetical protein
MVLLGEWIASDPANALPGKELNPLYVAILFFGVAKPKEPASPVIIAVA